MDLSHLSCWEFDSEIVPMIRTSSVQAAKELKGGTSDGIRWKLTVRLWRVLRSFQSFVTERLYGGHVACCLWLIAAFAES